MSTPVRESTYVPPGSLMRPYLQNIKNGPQNNASGTDNAQQSN